MDATKKRLEMDELLADYLSGAADREILKELAYRIEISEVDRTQAREMLEVWFATGAVSVKKRFDVNKAYKRFQHKIASTESDIKRPLHRVWLSWYRVAGILLLLLLPFAAYKHGKEELKQTFADIVIETPRGAQTKLYLPDGTTVWLNAESRISYSQGFGVDERSVLLEGEGYFEVVKNEDKPFKIHTQELDLRVVGTKFNFKNYKEDEEVVVNLIEGKVLLHNALNDMAEVELNPAEKAILDKKTGNMIKMKANVHVANAWSRNELFFDVDLLEDIAKELERVYNVKINVADSLCGTRFYGIFPIEGGTVQEVLDAMASTGRMKYIRIAADRYQIY